MSNRYILIPAIAIALASCSQDEPMAQDSPLPDGQYPLELSASGLQTVVTSARSSSRGTMDGNWDGVERVRVRVNNMEKEYRVEASADNTKALITPAVPLGKDDAPFWWTSTAETKTVTAWAPYDYALNETIKFPAEWTKEDFARYDIIGVSKTIGFQDRNEPLVFQHLMAKFVFNLRKTPYLENAKNVKVLLRGRLWCNGRMSLSQGQLKINYKYVEEDDRQLTTPYHIPEDEYKDVDFGDGRQEKPFASYTALVPPLYGAVSPLLIIEVDNAKYELQQDSFTDEDFVSYNAGQVYTFNVTVKENGIEVTTATGGEWTDGGSEDVASKEVMQTYSASDLKPGDYYYTDGTWSDGGLRKLYADGTMKWIETTPHPEGDNTCIGIVFYTGRHETDQSDYSQPLTEDGPTIPEGVFHGYVVALTDVNNDRLDRLRWEYGPNQQYDQNINASTSRDDWNGYSNNLKFHEFVSKNADWEMKHFPAAFACEAYGKRTLDKDGNPTTDYDWQQPLAAPSNSSGWFLPSCDQLRYLNENRSFLSDCMNDLKNSPSDCSYKDKIEWFGPYYYWSSTEGSSPGNALFVAMGTISGIINDKTKDRQYNVRAVLAF